MPKLHNKIRVGITMGDPSGIGPLIIRKALNRIQELAEFVVIGDTWVFSKIQNPKSKIQNYKFIDLNNVSQKKFEFGKIKAKYGKASVEYLDKALELIRKKEIDCLVTCPVSKEAINEAGIKFSGQTEYFAQKTGARSPVMMLLNKQLKFSLATRHLALKDVSLALTKDQLYKTILITYRALKNLFLIKSPRIVVCGLNPHASDNGILGNEEDKIIKPVLKRIKKVIKYIDGPLASDTAITKAYQKEYDCVVAMYHDQALIPLKLIGSLTKVKPVRNIKATEGKNIVSNGVNLTLGLPFIRTSPLHGTAFDIAATTLANPDSLIQAIKLAIQCTLNQRKA